MKCKICGSTIAVAKEGVTTPIAHICSIYCDYGKGKDRSVRQVITKSTTILDNVQEKEVGTPFDEKVEVPEWAKLYAQPIPVLGKYNGDYKNTIGLVPKKHSLTKLLFQFEDGKERFNKSTLFNRNIQMLLEGADPLKLIGQLITMVEANEKILGYYIKRVNSGINKKKNETVDR